MDYFYLLFPFLVWIISQTIKFLVRLGLTSIPRRLKGLFWTYMWAGGAPSTHTAILVSSLILVWHDFGPSPLLTFCLAITMLRLYDLVQERKKEELMDEYYNHDRSLKKVVSDGRVLDSAGHTFGEVAWGAVLGLVLGFIAILLNF